MESEAKLVDLLDVSAHLVNFMKGKSPLVAVIGWLPPDKILLGRDSQRWLITIQEVPPEVDM